MKQGTLFELDAEPVSCLKTETVDALSRKRDRERCRHLVSLAARVQRSSDPIERACLATAARETADALVDASIVEANRNGTTWRDIGARLGTPFQTLHRRYSGAADRLTPALRSERARWRLAVRSASRRDPDIKGDA